MALSKEDLESVTKQSFLDALHKHDLLGMKDASSTSQVDMSAVDSELIPTEYEAQKAYYKNRKRKYGDARVPVPDLTPSQFGRLPLRNFDEGALDENAQPLQSLTKTYITMMENEGSDGDNWDRALEILYPEKEDK
jgi:hypothetical protein